MTNRLTYFFYQLIESYLFIVALSLAAGLLLPKIFAPLDQHTTLFLQIIFFLSSLKLDLKDFKESFRDMRDEIVVIVYMLLFLPILVFVITSLVIPDLAIPLTLLAAMPAGLTTPLLSEVVKGNLAYSIILTTATCLLAPLTIPLLINSLFGSTIQLDTLDMFLRLVKVIVLPFVLARLVKLVLRNHVQKSFFTFKPISLTLLGLLIAAIVAKNAVLISTHLDEAWKYLLIDFIFLTLLHPLGYFLTFWQNKKDKVTVSVAVTYMNFTLAVYLGGIYFNTPEVILTLVFIAFPWALMLVPYKYILNKFKLIES